MSRILLVSNDSHAIKEISQYCLAVNYALFESNNNTLMLDVYRYDVKLIIIDLDYCNEVGLNIITNIKSNEYMPLLYIASNQTTINEKRKTNDFFILKNNLNPYTLNVISNFIEFKEHYDDVKEHYNTINNINGETDKIFKNTVYKDNFNLYDSVNSILENTFLSNKYLNNKPSKIMVSTKNADKVIAYIYDNLQNSIVKQSNPIIFNYSNNLGINIKTENEFFRNYDKQEFSDIDNYQDVFAKSIIDRLPQINNFVGYTTTDTAVVAFNYENKVTSFDGNIIKGLCVNFNLINNIYAQITEVNSAFGYTVEALARASEANDDDTGNHIKRVNEYSKLIAQSLGLDKKFVDTLYFSAQMHDVGKIHVPTSILKKPGKLTDEEFTLMKMHTVYGAEIIGSSPHLKIAKEIALNHHEKYDGSGYPYRKTGNDIPLSARIVALADIYDALRSPRVYKPSFDNQKTYEIITNGDGRVMPGHFDPEVLDIFKKIHSNMNDIYNELV